MRTFVALDLELTPFLSEQQRIIEIAAVRFRDGHAIDTFASLVDPRCDLTHRVAVLTGIQQEDVDGAPPLDCVARRLVDFLGNDPLVGQSIDLDLQRLAACGIHLDNHAYDTYELATVLVPGLPAYDLGHIARSLGVKQEHRHRALDDALAAGEVFLALLRRATQLDPRVLAQINAIAARIPHWPYSDLFAEAQQIRVKEHFLQDHGQAPGTEEVRGARCVVQEAADSFAALRTSHSALLAGTENPGRDTAERSPASVRSAPLRPSAQPASLDVEEMRSLLRPGGALATALVGFEEREEQLRMMEAVTEALSAGEHLLVEAGTGTGKSLAYLLPSVYYAVRNGKPVVISTNTINLQDQLYHKDIPTLQRSLPIPFKAALLKGRSNYLCLRRWTVLSRQSEMTPAEATLLIKTLVWLAATETGDRSELNLSDLESPLWARISAQAESCAMMRCAQFRRGSCFVMRARRNAESAHIVVVNHALLLSDLATQGGVLPEYSHVVVDEAHHLEEEATEQLGFTLSREDLFSFLAGLHQLSSGQHPAGFLLELLLNLRPAELTPTTLERFRELVSMGQKAVEAAMEEGRIFFDALDCFLNEHAADCHGAGTRLRITGSVRVQPGWSEIDVRWAELSARLHSLQRLLSKLRAEVDRLEDEQMLEREGALAEIAGLDSYLERLRTQGDLAVSSPSPNGIYWIEGGAGTNDLAIRSAPLHVGEALNAALFSVKDSVILTSATLTTEGSFDYIRERLGLEEARELVLGSPFDYEMSTLLYVVRDIPEPNRPTCQRAVESAIADLVTALQGRTLVLFTSHAQLRQTSATIRCQLEQQGILVLAHGVDGSRRRLLQAFISSPKAVLMGTSSFWEGIDVVGEALSCLVIVKLPFAVPTDPIFAARSEAFEEPFRQYSVPQTILKFRQGFGRLIRTRSDRGVVVILDSRVGNKFYGPSFIHSLPRCTVRVGPAAHLAEAARSWLRES